MSELHSVPVKISDRGNSDKNYESSIQIQSLNSAQEFKNGLKALGICWLVGIGCIALPVVHFFLVPGMFVVGIVMFVMRTRLKLFRPAFEIACPNCQAKIPIKAGPFNWPIREMCQACRADAVIEQR